jgi:hypothetical protein
MANEQKPNPATGQESDISKSQAQQQPAAQAGQQAPTGQQAGQFETSQKDQQAEFAQDKSAASPDVGQQGDTMAQQRTDIEGGSLGSEETEEPESGFVGSKGERDTSGLIEDEDFEKDGQGAPEGK